MSNRVRIIPYRSGSKSVKSLRDALSVKSLKYPESSFQPVGGDLLINWGRGEFDVGDAKVLNHPEVVASTVNKLTFFQRLKLLCPNYLPDYWTKKEDISDEDFPVVCRTKLTGSRGDGIVIADSKESLVNASLYVKYISKKSEFRVHLCRGLDNEPQVLVVQQKRRDMSVSNPNWKIRNVGGGFIYAVNDVDNIPQVTEAAVEVFMASGLDFGAADVIWNESKQRAYVLELNSAPALLSPTVLDAYVTYFKEMIDNA